jgi:nitronate monooxygenase
MKIRTTITDMLGIDLPILGAPMFLVSYPDLVVAVSECGGIGCFPALNYRDTIQLKDALQLIRSRTKKPIGVNIILHKGHNPDWQKQFETCLDEKVELFIMSLGTPRTIIGQARSIGAKVFCDITTLKHARLVTKAGADAIIAVAAGAGGHSGNISPFSLFPYIKKETGLPLIAAGSIGNGKQMLAALALGADAVYVGTRLIATREAQVPDEYKKMLIDAVPEDIVYTDKITGIKSNWLKQSLLAAGYSMGFEDKTPAINSLSAGLKKWKDIWSAGHGVAQIQNITTVQDVIESMVLEYTQNLGLLPIPT